MKRSVTSTHSDLVHVQSRGWLLGKLGIAALLVAAAVLVWGPFVAGRPNAMRLAAWLGWAAIALLALGAIVRVTEAVWGTVCIAYVLGRSAASAPADLGRALRSPESPKTSPSPVARWIHRDCRARSAWASALCFNVNASER